MPDNRRVMKTVTLPARMADTLRDAAASLLGPEGPAMGPLGSMGYTSDEVAALRAALLGQLR